MENLTLNAEKREKTFKSHLNSIRNAGMVPGVVYGLDATPELITVKLPDLRAHLDKKNQVIDLNLNGKTQKVMFKIIDRDPIRLDILHIDFLRVNNERPVLAKVPVTTSGVPYGVKTEGGVFSVMKKFVRIKAKVQDIPESFHMDISEMPAGKVFYVRELAFDKGTVVTPGKTALFGVSAGRKQEEVAAPAKAAKGKK